MQHVSISIIQINCEMYFVILPAAVLVVLPKPPNPVFGADDDRPNRVLPAGAGCPNSEPG